ncbi:MAG: hypothetical protein JWL59_4792 [Chthoniobacteraceae bacterium]|nr:hypothetical protein [Chthoniobacteraceae bacterium]
MYNLSTVSRLRRVLAVLAAAAPLSSLPAQSFFTNPSQFITPVYRDTANSEYSNWDIFYSPYNGANYPDMAAPNGIGGLASEALVVPPSNSNPFDPYAFWSAANPTITQKLESRALVVGPGTTGNIYSFSGPTGFELQDSTSYALGSVNLQWQTDGSLIDYSTLKLTYLVAGSPVSITPVNFITEYQASGSSFGFSLRNRISAQWDLSGLNTKDYTITWQSVGSSSSLQQTILDTSATYLEATPSTRVWNGGGGGGDVKWSSGANWVSGTVPSPRGNVTFNGAAAVTLDSSREVSLLTLGSTAGISIASSNGSKLKVNSGITATAGVTVISAPLTLGSFNLFRIGSGADVSISGPMDGSSGFYKTGGGTLRVSGAISIGGQILLGGGTTYLSGVNTYTGALSVFSGELYLQGNAPVATSGTLGKSSETVSIGGGGTIGDPAAAVWIDGPFSVDRAFSIENGAEPKILGAQNAVNGASYTGAVLLASGATEVALSARATTDRLSFSGAVSGGAAGSTLKITGSGTVLFAGANKTYLNDTIITSGTLQIAAGTSLNGNGRVVVGANSKLVVAGTLNGSGDLLIDSGTVSGSGTINRPFEVGAGDRLSPGNNIGKLNSVGQTWAGGGRLLFEIGDPNGSAGVGWDMVTMTGALELTATTAAPFTLELSTLTAAGVGGPLARFDFNQNYSWIFSTATQGIGGYNSNAFAIDSTGFANPRSGFFYVSASGNDLQLNYVVPEPGALLLALGGLAVILNKRRRKAPDRRN